MTNTTTAAGRAVYAAATRRPSEATVRKGALLRRAAQLDNLELAAEVSRTASVAARHLTHAEADLDGHAAEWRTSAARHEDAYLVFVTEARRRLEDPAQAAELTSYLNLYGDLGLVVA